MIRDQLLLSAAHDELIFDNFAGGGGFSVGIEMALGRPVDHAINHDAKALGMHRINHPQTIHHCEDIFDVNPGAIAAGKRIGYAHFSPDCKHFSKAKGGKPLSKKIRGLVLIMFRYAACRTRVMSMENVEEITTWGPLLPNGQPDPKHKGRTWRAFLAALSTGLRADHPDLPMMLRVLNARSKRNPHPMAITKEQLVRGFGYQLEHRLLRGCDYGARTIRKRLFLVCRCDGRPIVWPKPSHYDPKKFTSAPERGLKRYGTIAECIDWSLPCPSIFLTRKQARQARCKRPLARPTLHRVAAGIGRYVLDAADPFLINLTHGTRLESIHDPVRTLTGANRGEKAVVDTSLAPFITEHANATHQRNFRANEPARTICAEVKGGHLAVVSPTLVHVAHGERDQKGKKRGRGAKAITEPLPSVLASNDTAVVAAYLAQNNFDRIGKDVREPITTITTKGHQQPVIAASLVVNTTAHPGAPVTQPAPTIPTGGHHAVVAANMVKLRGDNVGHHVAEPGHTASAGGNHHAVSAVYLAQHNAGFNTNPGHPADQPISPITTKGCQQQVVSAAAVAYYGTEKDGQAVTEGCRTVTAKARLGLAITELAAKYPGLTLEQVRGAHRVAKFLRRHGIKFEGDFATVTTKDGSQWIIVDIGMRMLTPRELFRAQGFHERYIIDEAWLINPRTGKLKVVKLTKEEQIRMCGNSVCPDVAEALTLANVPELAVWNARERQRRKQELSLVA